MSDEMQVHNGTVAEARLASVIVPTFNGSTRIASCLKALLEQLAGRDVELIVIDDGSSDQTVDVVTGFSGVRVISQANAGPAAARNRGALEAKGKILLFTDDDCVPMPGWIDAMLAPFRDSSVVGVKGTYNTQQRQLAARFVQIEYEDKYRIMARLATIDFIDTYSAAFLRNRFREMNGYDTSFPVACAEDVELSYRMSARGWKMVFAPHAIVCHTHPDTFLNYLKKKYKFAFWRVLAVRKNPSKGVKDSHTPQIMKLQLLFGPALIGAVMWDVLVRSRVSLSVMALAAFFLSTLPFAWRAFRKDRVVGLLSPALLAARACAQVLGLSAGLLYALRKRPEIALTSG